MNEMTITQVSTTIPEFVNKDLQDATKKVFKIGETVRKCAFETTYIMATVDASECYKDDGFDSVHAWAMKTFGFKKSASYALLKTGREYVRTILDAKGRIKGYASNLLTDKELEHGDDFSTAQIEKMLPAGHDLVADLVQEGEIVPEMSCRDIAKVIKAHTAPEESDESEEVTEETGDAEDDGEEVIYRVVTDDVGGKYSVPVEILEQYRITAEELEAIKAISDHNVLEDDEDENE